jgi:tetraacyldisaccharide 4'-kinase
MLRYPEFWNKVSIKSILLFPLSLIFLCVSVIRKFTTKTVNLGFPAICIGNASVGGTGKTPIIKAIAKHYLKMGKKVVVISKGYGGNYVNPTIIEPNFEASFAGDEAIELAWDLFSLGDVTIICAKNPANALHLIKGIKPDLILVDDGLQNPSFVKDFIILAVDGIRAFGNNMIVPAGPLREKASSAISRADVVVSVNPDFLVKDKLENLCEDKFIEIHASITSNLNIGTKILLFSGIGNPDKLYNQVKEKYDISNHITYPDHHNYSESDIDGINKQAVKFEVDKIVTTKKDVTKLKNKKFIIDLEILNLNLVQEDILKIIAKIDEKIFKN